MFVKVRFMFQAKNDFIQHITFWSVGGGSQISGKGVHMYKGRGGVVLPILSHFS